MSSAKKTAAPDPVAETAAHAVNTVNPVPADTANGEQIQITLDPQLLQQAIQMKNARVMASLVHENAVYEVALEQYRREIADLKAQNQALKAQLLEG